MKRLITEAKAAWDCIKRKEREDQSKEEQLRELRDEVAQMDIFRHRLEELELFVSHCRHVGPYGAGLLRERASKLYEGRIEL